MTAPACGAARYGPCERPQVKLSIRGLRPQATDPDRRTALEYSNVIDRERLRETSIGCWPAPTTPSDLPAESSHQGGALRAPLARRQRRAQPLGEARPAHAGPHHAGTQTKPAHTSRMPSTAA